MKNRKTTHPYRFNGHPYFHTRSIHPVRIAELEACVGALEKKLADPGDPDDRKWTARWLGRYRRELEKKRRGLALKWRERKR